MSEEITTQPVTRVVQRGGFLNGGMPLSLLFLFSFFLVSFSLGMYVEKSNKLTGIVAGTSTVANAPAGNQAQEPVFDDGAKVTTTIDMDANRTKGNKDAKVTIVEFSDFECPYCGAFYNDTYKAIVDKYVTTGKAKIVYKDFPLSIHPQAQPAAEAARCAQEQGKFWEMHDKLFENQKTLSTDTYKRLAQELKLDTNKFNSCVDSKKYADAVKKDLSEGVALGVRGTPSFVINGVALVGAQPIGSFEKAIDEALK